MEHALLALDELVILKTRPGIRNNYSIADATGAVVGVVEEVSSGSEIFRGALRLTAAATDAAGTSVETVFEIRVQPRVAMDIYEIRLPGEEEPLAVVQQKWTMRNTHLNVAMEGFTDAQVLGRFWDRKFEISAREGHLASLTMSWKGTWSFLRGEVTYNLAIAPGLDARRHAALIGATICLDLVHTKQLAQNSS